MIRSSTNPVARRGEELSPVLWQGRQWSVTTYGMEARDGTYAIAAGRLAETLPGSSTPCWPVHMAGKSWTDLDDFATAFLAALALHGQRIAKHRVRESIAAAYRQKARSLAFDRELDRIAARNPNGFRVLTMQDIAAAADALEQKQAKQERIS